MVESKSKYGVKSRGVLIHVMVWAVFFLHPLFFTGGRDTGLTWYEYLRFITVPLSFMAVFYANYFVLISRFIPNKKILNFFLFNFLLVVAVMAAVHIVFHYVLPPGKMGPPHRPWMDTVRFFAGNFVIYMLIVAASVAIKMTSWWYKEESARKEMEHRKTEAELQNLKNQINPHFLFNTLNNIYSLIQSDSAKAQKVVHDLSSLLRYVLYESSMPYVPVRAEMEFLRDYVELMRIRLPRNVNFSVSFPDSASDRPIAPLLFIPLVENAFKHGTGGMDSFISIGISEDDNSVACSIENSYYPKSVTDDRTGSGIGISNLLKRLEMIYPGRYSFEYGHDGNVYRAVLSISDFSRK